MTILSKTARLNFGEICVETYAYNVRCKFIYSYKHAHMDTYHSRGSCTGRDKLMSAAKSTYLIWYRLLFLKSTKMIVSMKTQRLSLKHSILRKLRRWSYHQEQVCVCVCVNHPSLFTIFWSPNF